MVGGAVMAFGIYGLLADRGGGVTDIKLGAWLLWFFGVLVAHDGVVAPLTHLIGGGLRRVRPVLLRTPLQVGLALSAMVSLFALPLLRDWGEGAQPTNASVQPIDYTSAWLVVLAVVWGAAGALALWPAVSQRAAFRRRQPRGGNR